MDQGLRLHAAAGRLVFVRIVQYDVFLLVGVVPRHDGVRRFAIAEVDGLVRDVRWDEDEVAGFVDHRFPQTRAETGLYPSFQEVDGRFETTANVRPAPPEGITTRFIERPVAPVVRPAIPTK